MRCTAVLGVVVVVVVVMSRQGASHASWNVRVSRSQGESIDVHNKLAQGALFRHHLSSRTTAGMVCVLQILSWFFSYFACVCVYFVWRDDRDRRKRIGCPFGCSSTPYIGKGDVVDI